MYTYCMNLNRPGPLIVVIDSISYFCKKKEAKQNKNEKIYENVLSSMSRGFNGLFFSIQEY